LIDKFERALLDRDWPGVRDEEVFLVEAVVAWMRQ
jgi:hypothetical protein